MKNFLHHLSILLLFTSLLLIVSCGGGDDDDDLPMPTGDQVVYELDAVGSSGVS